MATYSGACTDSRYELRLSVNQDVQNIPANTTSVPWYLEIVKVGSGTGIFATDLSYWSATIDGLAHSGSFTYDFRNGVTVKSLASGTKTVTHNADGTKTMSSSSSISAVGLLGSGAASGSLALTTIPRGGGEHYDGAAWDKQFVEHWNGSAWVLQIVEHWNGSSWARQG